VNQYIVKHVYYEASHALDQFTMHGLILENFERIFFFFLFYVIILDFVFLPLLAHMNIVLKIVVYTFDKAEKHMEKMKSSDGS